MFENRPVRVVVIGAGVFGAWTAHHLLEAGASVTLVDAYGPGNLRSSSGDETRILRCGYGPDRIYSEMAWRSLAQWRELDAAPRKGTPYDRGAGLDAPSVGRPFTGRNPLWHPCGVLWMASPDDAYFKATVSTLQDGAYSVELLTAADVRGRYPQLRVPDGIVGLLEPECGVLMARRAVQSLVSGLRHRGVRFVRERVTSMSELEADAIVFACGAWLGRIFPDVVGERIAPTRQTVVYFGTPPGDDRFSAERFPAWITREGIYGTPEVEGRGVKVGLHELGPPMDPDADDRVPDEHTLQHARAWLAANVPAMANAPVVETRVCQYENTDTGDFLIDRHPGHDHVWLVGGGSGHGFKHGPAVGELVARLVTTGAATEPRFSLAARTVSARRAIY